jgi:leader peptidase (prepilin peptidase)/N-methyltransferase
VISLIIFFLIWGSFLNVLAVRLINGKSLLTRSECLHCHKLIAWYDNIPLLSFLILRCKCRKCAKKISFLYPFIELLTVILMITLWQTVPQHYFYAYFIFFSALIVTVRSDLETMLISRLMSIYLACVGVIASFWGFLPLSFIDSALSTFLAPLSLYVISWLFFKATGRQGLGQGDIDLLALIAAFTGFLGAWISLFIGSLLGSIVGIIYLAFTRQSKNTRIPFGPFLAFGAIVFVLFHPYILHFLVVQA